MAANSEAELGTIQLTVNWSGDTQIELTNADGATWAINEAGKIVAASNQADLAKCAAKSFEIDLSSMTGYDYDGSYDVNVQAAGHVVVGTARTAVDSTNWYVAGAEANAVKVGTLEIASTGASFANITFTATPVSGATLAYDGTSHKLTGTVYVSVRTTDNGDIGDTATEEGSHASDAISLNFSVTE